MFILVTSQIVFIILRMEFVKNKLGLTSDKDNTVVVDEIERRRMECTGRSYFYGMNIGTLTFCLCYFGQKFFTQNIKVSKRRKAYL